MIVAAFVLFFWLDNIFVLVLSAITAGLVAVAVLIYKITSDKGYKTEFLNRGAVKWELIFDDLGITASVYERGGEEKYTEKRLYPDVDKVAVLKDRVYIFAGPATAYYIKYDSAFSEGGNFIDFCEFIKTKFEPVKFKMKTKVKQFPYPRA